MYTREHLLLRIDAIDGGPRSCMREGERGGEREWRKRAEKREIVNDGREKDGKDRKGTKGVGIEGGVRGERIVVNAGAKGLS